MVESIALRIAELIKRIEPEKTASIAVLKFSLVAIINVFITFVFIFVIGFLTHSFIETVIGLFSFAILRFFSGGLHFRDAIHCSILSVILISLAPHITLSGNWFMIIMCLSLILLIMFAPANIEGHARLPKKYFPFLKVISLLIVATNFIFNSSTIALLFLFQALSTINLKRRWSI